MRSRVAPNVWANLVEVPPSNICISVITRAALAPNHRLHVSVPQFVRLVRVLPWDFDAAEYYTDTPHQLVSTGKTIGELDMIITAHSLSASAIRVNNNTRHFSRIAAPLTLVNWT